MKTKITIYIILLLTSIAAVVLSGTEIISDFFSGFGGGLAAVAILRLYQIFKFKTNPDYAKFITVENHDERNLLLIQKARSTAFTIGLLVLVASIIVLEFMHLSVFAQLLVYVICMFGVLYLIFYVIYKKKM